MSEKNNQKSDAIRLLRQALLLLAENYYVSFNKYDEPVSGTAMMMHRSVTPDEVQALLERNEDLKGKLKCIPMPFPKQGTSGVKVVMDDFRNHTDIKVKGRK